MTVSAVGGNVDGWCTRCKLVLAHTVEAVAKGAIKRVHCNTCQSKHQYRAGIPGEKTAVPRVSRALKSDALAKGKKGGPGLVKASHYEALMQGRDIGRAKPYAVKDRFGDGEVMTHAIFGVGLVTAQKEANKIEVLFKLGPKVLVHARG